MDQRTRRILAVAAVSHPGGAETTLMRLLRGLHGRGWSITLTSPEPGRVRDEARDEGFAWERLPLGGLGRGEGLRAVGAWPRARKLARQADVVYLNGSACGRLLPAVAGWTPPGARAPLPAAARKRVPRVVLHIHDMVTRVPPFWHRADVVLAASRAVAERLPSLDPLVTYPPVDGDPPPARPPWPEGNGPVIGFIGRIEPRKGVIDLVRAAPAIKRSLPDARVVVVGGDPYDGDRAYTEAVKASPEVEHFPWTDNAPGLMRHLDVLVLPSYEEPFGTVLAEAMAVGTPVVATTVDGLPEVVDDGVSGRLVAPGDPQALAAATLEVLADRARMGEAARRQAQRFATDAYVERIERLITS